MGRHKKRIPLNPEDKEAKRLKEDPKATIFAAENSEDCLI